MISEWRRKGILEAIESLRKDILRIEECGNIDNYIRGPRDIIHERLDGLIQYVGHIYAEAAIESQEGY
jgi:hypothetical protein